MLFCVDPTDLQNFITVKLVYGEHPHIARLGFEFYPVPRGWRQNRVLGFAEMVAAVQGDAAELAGLVRYIHELGVQSKGAVTSLLLSGVGIDCGASKTGKIKHLNYIGINAWGLVAELLGHDGVRLGGGAYSMYFTVSRDRMGWGCKDKTYFEVRKEIAV